MSVPLDPNEQRQHSVQAWEDAAPGWARRQRMMRDFGAPISHHMLAAINPQPGQRVLELAAGVGETGLLAAELVAPAGEVIISDQAQGMIDAARERARELQIDNATFEVYGAEWIDLPVASVDAILCRFGLMLMTDPAAALLEMRRVLRQNGRLAIAVWDQPTLNAWAHLPMGELSERGLIDTSPEQASLPGPFSLADRERLRQLIQDAGFTECEIEAVACAQRHPSFQEMWETLLDMSRTFHDAVLGQPESQLYEIREAIAARVAPHTQPDGSVTLPGQALVASATA